MSVGVLLVAAIAPLQRVYIGADWLRPTIGAAVLSVGVGWGVRRLRLGPVTHLLLTLGGLLLFCTVAFLPATAVGGVVPTPSTLAALRDLVLRGLELVQVRPSPTFAEPGLLLLTVGGVWIVAYLVDGMVHVMRSAAAAIGIAVVLWSVPHAIAPTDGSHIPWVVLFMAAAALLILLMQAAETASYGLQVPAPDAAGVLRPVPLVAPSGAVIAALAIVAGAVLTPGLPGFGEEAVYEVRGSGGTTITTNPIVNIRTNLVAADTGPVAHVTTARPVYLRTTALDVYNAEEQWTSSGISGRPVDGVVDSPGPFPVEQVAVDVEIQGIERGAILAPAPFKPIEVSGERADTLQYDPVTATLTVDGGQPLEFGDRYTVLAAVPQVPFEVLRTVRRPPEGNVFTALPANVPPEVATFARQVVEQAGAVSMADEALAIQDLLRSWTYSLDPSPGHGSTAMLRFLDSQEGYCEQFAGTMAVMLRALGIPARLAVGYTPGELGADGRWTVTNANAHAWVEVQFGEFGWVPFEPTPRADGNVLVPDANSTLPSQTVAQAQGLVPLPGELQPTPGATPSELPGALDAVPEDAFAVPSGLGEALPPGSGGGGSVIGRLILVLLLALVGAAATVLWGASDRTTRSGPPALRIAAARRRVERTGAALGVVRDPAETDEEYFSRLGGRAPAARAMADLATRADYARAVDAQDARAAEAAATTLEARLLDGMSARGRLGVTFRRAWPSARVREVLRAARTRVGSLLERMVRSR